jgi:SulP family sulfate permease
MAVVPATIIAALLHLDNSGLDVVGAIPAGLPRFTLPVFEPSLFQTAWPVILAILFVGYMQSYAVAESIADREGYRINPNRELVGLGLSNIVSGFTGGFPVTGGLARSAANRQAGAKTRVSNVIAGLITVITLLFLTRLFYFIPKSVLAAIVICAVAGMIDFRRFRWIWKVKRGDGVICMATFAVTLLIGIQAGIITGVILSLSAFVRRTARPHMVELGYIEREKIFRDISRFSDARLFPQIEIVRIDASIYFANANFIEDRLNEFISHRDSIRWLIVDFSGVNDTDADAVHTFERIMTRFQEKGISVLITGMKGPVRDIVRSAGWPERFGHHVKFNTIRDTITHLKTSHGYGGKESQSIQ